MAMLSAAAVQFPPERRVLRLKGGGPLKERGRFRGGVQRSRGEPSQKVGVRIDRLVGDDPLCETEGLGRAPQVQRGMTSPKQRSRIFWVELKCLLELSQSVFWHLLP